MITGHQDRIAQAIGAAHDADMAAVGTLAVEDGDGADARAVELLAVLQERARRARLRALAAGAAEHEIHEIGAPELGWQADLSRRAASPAQGFEQYAGGAGHLRGSIRGVAAAARHRLERFGVGETFAALFAGGVGRQSDTGRESTHDQNYN